MMISKRSYAFHQGFFAVLDPAQSCLELTNFN